jgi:NADP-dependent 3-hydroxy acid dehydrogenase YdfG
MELQGKKVIITGVSRGIGNALVHQYLDKGCIVAGLGLRDPKIDHPNFSFFTTNVREFENVETSIQDFLQANNNEVHILVNNAGLGYFGYIEDYSIEQIKQMFETNVYGTLFTCKMVVPVMKKQEYGHIVNIASTAGLEGYPQVSVYCGSKFAVRAISESMYKELRDFRIKVTCVYPGSVKTDFFNNSENIVPHDYMLMPQDVANMIVTATETPDNFHQVNLEVRPLQPKGPRKK